MNRQARGRQQQPCDLGLGTAFPVAISRTGRQAEHIRAGAAHIHPHQRLRPQARLLGGSHRADHAAGGPDRIVSLANKVPEDCNAPLEVITCS